MSLMVLRIPWQTTNGLRSPRTPSSLHSRVRTREEHVELKADAAGKGDGQDVNVFTDIMKPSGTPPPGLPQFNPSRVVS
jgi:hypothetical protein